MGKLIIETIFEKRRYFNIINLIDLYENKKIKFLHLRYALCLDNGINNKDSKKRCEKFFRKTDQEKEIYFKLNKLFYEKGLSDKKLHDIMSKKWYDSELDDLKEKGFLIEENMFNSFQSLDNALSRIIRLKIIERKKDTSGYNYYVITPYGRAKYKRWFIHWYIDFILKDELFDSYEETYKVLDKLFTGVRNTVREIQKEKMKKK